MAPVAMKMNLIMQRKACIATQRAVFGQNMAKLQAKALRRHVTRSTKLEEVEKSIKSEKKDKKKDEDEDFDGEDALSPQQVESLLTILCEETDIAEVELKMGGFKMKVRRSLKGGAAAAPAVAAAAAPAAPAPAPAAAPAGAAPMAASVLSSVDSDDEEDESLVPITAPKVGVLRVGRYVKGKRVGKGPVVDIGDSVKKGQIVCYIEQMGTHWPVEAPQAGEVAVIPLEDGDPVAYGDVLVELAPFFGGHIIGDSKYA